MQYKSFGINTDIFHKDKEQKEEKKKKIATGKVTQELYLVKGTLQNFHTISES